MELDPDRLLTAAAAFPPPEGVHFAYGTAGFRADASILDCAVFRAGIVAALRSLHTSSTIGLMITASHNPIQDNGVKIADCNGDMLCQDWEPFAESLANAHNPRDVLQVILDFIHKGNFFNSAASSGRVLLGRDTRPSGVRLLNAARQGVEAILGVDAAVMGVLTTPQLHWMVRASNRGHGASEQDYYSQLSHGFKCLLEMKPPGKGLITPWDGFIVDGANGVGASKLSRLQGIVKDLKLDIRNSGGEAEGLLNELVGADYVQKERKFPRHFGHLSELAKRCASLDGDADRIVFFYGEQAEGADAMNLRLLDGDKILTLFAMFIQNQLQELCSEVHEFPAINLGVVQTAYANGASTRFLKENLGIQVALTPTGVKHLHHKAAEFDIGLYFEANGHGTVLLKEEFLQVLRTFSPKSGTEGSRRSLQRLQAISEVVNQGIGDALSVLLLVEVALQYMGWSIQDWDSIYTDLPSRQLKVKVQDRTLIKTTDAETRVTHPLNLQAAIDVEAGKVSSGRAFVRPSGTEDVVRVYAEAGTQEEADSLARAVAIHVHELAKGVGAPP
ncbi:hypothetical protein GOP47_0022689 [Adiantum capillus-veneris]|uniref:Phosphoacetylglucosamine mutase n=1 Tax=Adiantum capillus-veneris TaxID=13818 RepID=A0A9D4U6A6_ADICA|nr:hypothetical protein GOP47_0022689 [Adiantum capillus-veneris]